MLMDIQSSDVYKVISDGSGWMDGTGENDLKYERTQGKNMYLWNRHRRAFTYIYIYTYVNIDIFYVYQTFIFMRSFVKWSSLRQIARWLSQERRS